jgi:MFS family permease
MTETKVYRNRNFQIVCAANPMHMMLAAVITPAFPTIMETLGISEQSIGLLISVFTLPTFLFTPLAGIMADRFGRKKLLVSSLFLYGIFGAACALAPDFKTLLVLRGLQGIGGAPMLAASLAIIGDLFSGQKRA